MGRTLPTIVQTLELEASAWRLFRRTLRKEDQAAFDALWRHARRHAAPASMAGRAAGGGLHGHDGGAGPGRAGIGEGDGS